MNNRFCLDNNNNNNNDNNNNMTKIYTFITFHATDRYLFLSDVEED